MVRKLGAYILLVSIYGFTWLAAVLGRASPRRRWKPNGRIMVTGTFHNPNWYLSHITPLTRSGVKEVILVVDEPQLPLDRVRLVCPHRWARRLLGRIGAQFVWVIVAGLRFQPDLYMGYHIVPGACIALVVAKLLGRPACYQMTAGPVEIVGGGFQARESIAGLLGCPSRLVEAMALAVVNCFELVVVRGSKAKRFLADHGVKGTKAIVTGSIQSRRGMSQPERDIHLVFVGRLAPVKQVDQFIAIVDAASHTMPSLRAAIVGEGPLMSDMRSKVEQLGLAEVVEFLGKRTDVTTILLRSRVFLLTSQSEGLSIAMAEAMSAGAVPIVANVGELGDLVDDGVNGHLVQPNCIDEYVQKVLSLLMNQDQWREFSLKAVETAATRCDIDVIAGKWRQHLRKTVSHASRVYSEEASKCRTS